MQRIHIHILSTSHRSYNQKSIHYNHHSTPANFMRDKKIFKGKNQDPYEVVPHTAGRNCTTSTAAFFLSLLHLSLSLRCRVVTRSCCSCLLHALLGEEEVPHWVGSDSSLLVQSLLGWVLFGSTLELGLLSIFNSGYNSYSDREKRWNKQISYYLKNSL
jgi:hypothetical protein